MPRIPRPIRNIRQNSRLPEHTVSTPKQGTLRPIRAIREHPRAFKYGAITAGGAVALNAAREYREKMDEQAAIGARFGKANPDQGDAWKNISQLQTERQRYVQNRRKGQKAISAGGAGLGLAGLAGITTYGDEAGKVQHVRFGGQRAHALYQGKRFSVTPRAAAWTLGSAALLGGGMAYREHQGRRIRDIDRAIADRRIKRFRSSESKRSALDDIDRRVALGEQRPQRQDRAEAARQRSSAQRPQFMW